MVQDSGWIMVGPLQSPEVDGTAGWAVTVQPNGLHLHPTREKKVFRGNVKIFLSKGRAKLMTAEHKHWVHSYSGINRGQHYVTMVRNWLPRVCLVSKRCFGFWL